MKQQMEEESINYNELVFKKGSPITTSDMKNDFITEEMILLPLYKKININNKLVNYKFFPYNDLRVECYCDKCKCRRIFSFENSKHAYITFGMGSHQNTVEEELKEMDYFTLRAQGDCNHKMLIILWKIDENTVMKIGQTPSIYDLDEHINNKKFLKILGEEYKGYYKSACSLYSFNTCIGALTYLRRIFEKLLIDTYYENDSELNIEFNEFKSKRMEDKVKCLKKYLPNIVSAQGFNSIYTKLSDGIHNLSEEECQIIFPVLKDAIEEILTEKIELIEKKKRIEDISNKLMKL